MGSVFIGRSGEWKLGGLEIISHSQDPAAPLWTMGNSLPDMYRYIPPEAQNGAWSQLKNYPVHVLDSWLYACLVYEVFNGVFSRAEQAQTQGSMPQLMYYQVKQMFNRDPNTRMSVADFFDMGTMKGSFFDTQFIQTASFLENLTVKDNTEKLQFFRQLPLIVDQYPKNFAKYKILPALMNALEYGSAGPKILGLILKMAEAHMSSPKEYNDQIIGLVIRLYSSPDRGVRMSLLESMESYITHMDKSIVNDKIFPSFVNGFNDTAPGIREGTLKAVILITPLLSERNVNNDLLRYLAKCQIDEEPNIRANTAICLGKIAKHLSDSTRKKILIPAFSKSLKDPFPPSRSVAVVAINATADYYDAVEVATKVLPMLAPLAVDTEKSVREQTFTALQNFVSRLQKHSETMPVPTQNSPNVAQNNNPASEVLDQVGALSKKLINTVVSPPLGLIKPNSSNTSSTNINPLPGSQPTVSPPMAQPVIAKASNDGWDDMEINIPMTTSPAMQTMTPTVVSAGGGSSGMKLGGGSASGSTKLMSDILQSEPDWASFPINGPPKTTDSWSMNASPPTNFAASNNATSTMGQPQNANPFMTSGGFGDGWGNAGGGWSDTSNTNNTLGSLNIAKSNSNEDLARKKAERKARVEELKAQRKANKFANAVDENSGSLI